MLCPDLLRFVLCLRSSTNDATVMISWSDAAAIAQRCVYTCLYMFICVRMCKHYIDTTCIQCLYIRIHTIDLFAREHATYTHTHIYI